MDVRASATSAQSSGLSTTMKCHGWELHADGCVDNAHHRLARHAALRVVATVALTLVNKFIKIGHRLF